MARVCGADDEENNLLAIIFSWSLEDIIDDGLYKQRVDEIPEKFHSVDQYLKSFKYPLLEEVRADICSSIETISTLPYAEVTEFKEKLLNNEYKVEVDFWRNRLINGGNEPCKICKGDLLFLTKSVPETAADLLRMGRECKFTYVCGNFYDEDEQEFTSLRFKVTTGTGTGGIDLALDKLFVIQALNLTTNERIWTALRSKSNLNFLENVLCTDSLIEKECDICTFQDITFQKETETLVNDLNKSQADAIMTCLRKTKCPHKAAVELIWGPPGTGKTKTTATMLFSLIEMNCKTVVCAPTNVAVVEVASRLVQLMKNGSASMGDILLFGNKERLNVENSAVRDIYLDYRIKSLRGFLAPRTGWKYCITSAITFLKDPIPQYRLSPENEHGKKISFLKHCRKRFSDIHKDLERCLLNLCTHISVKYIPNHVVHEITNLLGSLTSFGALLWGKIPGRLEEVFSCRYKDNLIPQASTGPMTTLKSKRNECLAALDSVLHTLDGLNLPCFTSKGAIKKFCFGSATLIFSTVSSAFKLRSVDMEPPKLLVVDEAAQLKECESVIVLQLRRLQNAIFIGDERQLPSVVKSDVSKVAHFGRSLFERLSSLGKAKHPLNVQYRMHPSISCFPNQTFYGGQILNGSNVMRENYTKKYLPGEMFGSYSFINISVGGEERERNGPSLRNIVETAVASQILDKLLDAWKLSCEEKLSVGIISPYAGQVREIRKRLGKKYERTNGFTVTINTVDGFQGREQDIIILPTVRSNDRGSIGFLANPNRTNVALTRARHAVWILGNRRTLLGSSTVWKALIYDAIDRKCFFNANDDKGLAKTISKAKKEYDFLSSKNKSISDSQLDMDHEKLLETKFQSLSLETANNQLCDQEGGYLQLPVEVTKEQREAIQFPGSMFVLGSSGTGKTTVLAMKLFHRMAAINGDRMNNSTNRVMENSEEMADHASAPVLNQLFVTASEEQCLAVKQQLSHLKRPVEVVPDSFVDIPTDSYPLVITFRKFLMMLDGSTGDSYFEKFPHWRDMSSGKLGAERSLALQDFMQEKEVDYDKFSSTYWPHFDEKLTRELDALMVFLELVFNIKGCLQVKESPDSKLSRTDYVKFPKERSSCLSRYHRHNVYDIFLEYEMKKLERGEFDLSDVAIDLHTRLRCEKMKANLMDFVYIDDVLDLTMKQVSLFKYVSQNPQDGFVLSGATTRTIGKVTDSILEDMHWLFDEEFSPASGSGRKASKIFQLTCNFRSHAGILKLAQSVGDILSHFFSSGGVDVPKAEASSSIGESPIFLKLGTGVKSLLSVFNKGSKVSGVGKDQVILVRDNCAKARVHEQVGEQVHIITIAECKGLQCQDVVLYNFFGSSPMKTQWKVIYNYMKARDLLDNSFAGCIPQFNPIKHNPLCSELKQLYIAITRTRQRLWICEDSKEFSEPMLKYWQKLGIIRNGRETQHSKLTTQWKPRAAPSLGRNRD